MTTPEEVETMRTPIAQLREMNEALQASVETIQQQQIPAVVIFRREGRSSRTHHILQHPYGRHHGT